jgi:serine/threonine-protein kinase
MPLQSGATFAGYTVRRLLGSGGMGEVYLVEHPRLPRLDALKVLREATSASAEFRVRFNREAELAASLWHPHIVGLHDRGEFEGQLWITMDYVEGTDAAHLLKGRHPNGIPRREVAAIVSAVASALDYAHERGLLHRDVKPANILLTAGHGAQRRILLSDFGIARQMGDVSGLTETNHAIGTVTYSAPEQLMGGHVDGRADQYALAATAFRLLTGESPFQDSNPVAVISQHLHAPAPRVSSRRGDLAPVDAVLMTAMAKDPRERFATCSQFAEAFAQQAALATPAPLPAPQGWSHTSHPSPVPAHTMPWATPGPPGLPMGPPPGLLSHQLAFTRPPARRSRVWVAVVAGVVAVALIAAGVVIALNVGGDDTTANQTSKSSETSTSRRSSATTSTPMTFAPPTLVGVPGNYETIQTYIQKNDLEEKSQHRGDTSAPTVLTPMPDGWRDAGSESPNFAYQTLVYDGADAPNSRPYLIVILSKVTGNVDPQTVFSLASGELYNLPGWVPDNPGAVGKLDGYPEFQLSGVWTSEGKPQVVAQKTVVLNWKQGFYVLQINTYAAPEYRPILERMVAAVDKDAKIYPP